MGFTARPPSQESTIFNPNYYALSTDVLSLEMADTLYLSKTDYRMSYLSSITMGEAAPMSALVVDANRNISGINAISCSSIQLNGSSVDLSNLSLLSASPGAATASKAIILNSNKEIATLNSIDSVSYKQNGVAYDLSRLSAAAGTAEASKALITDSAYGISGLRSLIVKDSGLSKSLVVQNDVATSAASLNIVSYYQMEQGVRGNTNSTTPNCYFWRYALSDRLLMDSSGNMAIGQATVNTSYKLDVNGAIRGTSFVQGSATYDLSKIGLISITTNGTAEASKALITDSAYGITGLRSLTIKDSGLAKSLVIENTIASSAASMNFVSYYQAQVGVRGSTNAGGTNQFFINFALADVLTIDSAGNVNIPYSLTVAGQAISGASNVYMTPTPGDTSLTTISEYNLVLGNLSNAAAATGIAFFSSAAPDSSIHHPGASIVAKKVSSTLGGSGMDLIFYTKTSSQTSSAALSERMRIKENGDINFGTTGDQDFNMLRPGQLDTTLRFGADLSVRDCYSMTFHRDSAGALTNYLAFNNYGTSNTLVLTAQDRVGIGTNTPACGLDVFNFASVSMTGPLATGTSSAYTVNRSGTFTDSVSIYCRQALMVGTRGIYVGSDRRVKENINTIPPEDGVKFVRDIDPKIYTLKGFDKRQIGYISQDMMQDYSALLSLLPDPNMTIEKEGDVDGAFISLSYERVPAFLHAALKSVLDRLDELESKLATLI